MIARIRSAWNQDQGARGSQPDPSSRFSATDRSCDATIVQVERYDDPRHGGASRGPGDAHAAAAARRVSESDADHASQFRIPMTKSIIPAALAIGVRSRRGRTPQQPAQPPARRSSRASWRRRSPAKAASRRGSRCRISSRCRPTPKPSRPRRRSARCCGTTSTSNASLRSSRATSTPRSRRRPRSTTSPFDRWRELNADGVIVGTVQKVDAGFSVEMKLFNVRTRQAVFAQGTTTDRTRGCFAHTISDEIHKSQRALNGVARSKLTFDSDRDGERMTGTVQSRSIKEIYITDYDGENQRRVTTGRTLNIAPRWSPDGRSIAYTSYRRGGANLFISNIFAGHAGRGDQGRQGRRELAAGLVARRHQAGLQHDPRRQPGDLRRQPRRLRLAAADQQPEHRHHADLVAVGDADCLHLRPQRHAADLCRRRRRAEPRRRRRPSRTAIARPGRRRRSTRLPLRRGAVPASISACSTSSTNVTKSLTFGEGTNESPAFSPNGRHIVFTSTRAGKTQVFTMARDGKNVRQITKAGNNYEPDWSK